ncbi:MAG: hypothetical protein ACYC4U_25535 [Pirellulaceae bacterium]
MVEHDVYRRTAMRCWGVAILAAIIVLPGAAMHTSAGEEAQHPASATTAERRSDRAVSTDPSTALGLGVADTREKPPIHDYAYGVNDVLEKIREERGLSESEAKDFLTTRVSRSVLEPTSASDQHLIPDRIVWSGSNMIIEATDAGHQQIADIYDAIRTFGTSEIAIEVRFVTLNEEEQDKVLPDWTASPLDVPETTLADSAGVRTAAFDHPLGTHAGTHVARAQFVLERDSPVRFRLMEKEQGEDWISRCRTDHATNAIQAPKVTVFSGQTAFVSDTSQTPFVVGVKEVKPGAYQPQIRVVSEGTSLQLRPIADRSNAIHLDFAATLSRIQKVEETVCFDRAATSGKTIQIPEVATIRLEGGVTLQPGQWLLLGGPKAADQAAQAEPMRVSWTDRLFGGGKRFKRRETQQLVLVLRADRIQLPQVPANDVLPVR